MDTFSVGAGRVVSAFALVVIGLAAGCTGLDQPSNPKPEEEEFFKKWQDKAAEARGYSPDAAPRVLDLPERAAVPTATAAAAAAEAVKPLPTTKITELTMRDTEVSVALRSLAKIAGVNILISEGVQGLVSIELRDVPWNQAFDGILKTHNLRFQWEGEILRVQTFSDLQAELESQKITQERLLLAEDSRQAEPLVMRTVSVNYADAESLRKTLEDVLVRSSVAAGGKEGQPEAAAVSVRGSVLLNKASNTLILHAVRDDLAKMIELVEALDRPTPQILIEAHIVEATSGTARELGVEWGGLYKTDEGNWINSGSSSSDSFLGKTLTDTLEPVTGPVADFPVKDLAGGGMTLGYMYYEEGKQMLYAQLQALERESKLNILSSPSVTTLDNLEASIESGRDVPYETASADGGNDVEWKQAVLRLTVTPHVMEGKLVKLLINVLKDELDFDNVITKTSAGANYPLVITKKAKTTLILHDGETTVIGGLSKENQSNAVRGIPFLKDIPVLGYLFSSHTKSKDMDELLIFITPHVLPPMPAR